ncbi:MAG TPA: DNA primase, partial [Thermomicrobiales bacterium]|nr:DNA primase [Thermomicrobiales bacterium]
MAHDAVSDVRERTDIVDLVSQYVQLKKAGRSYKGLCPFHQEKTPSFIVFPDSQNFHCFGCGKGGDVFTFYQSVEHVDFKETLTELARRAGIQLSSIPTVAPEVDAHRQRLIELNELAATFYANILANSDSGAPGRQLAEQRGLTAEVIAKFQLGFAPDGWDNLHRYFSTRGVDPALAAESGLLAVRDSGGYYDKFRNRFMFPIRNRDGHVVGFGGRALGDAQPKYLNSPQSPIFDKSSLVYALDLAKEEIRRRDQVVIVEGYMDAVAAHQFGHGNVVAAMGTALTDAQVDQLKRLSKRIVLALDADAAGQLATLRSLESMQSALDHEEVPVTDALGIVRFERKLNADIAIVQLPEGKDPDELIRNSPDSWPEVVATARPFLDFYIDTVTANVSAGDGRGKSEAVGRVAPVLRQIADRIVQSHYIGLLARRLDLDERVVTSEIRRSALQRGPVAPTVVERAPKPTGASHEDHLLALLLRHRSLCRDLLPLVPDDDLMDGRNRALLQVLRDESIPDELDPIQIVAGLDDPLADHAERLLGQLEGKPAQLPGQVQREVRQSLDLLSKERFTFLLRQLQAEIAAAQQVSDNESLGTLMPQLAILAERHRRFYPP